MAEPLNLRIEIQPNGRAKLVVDCSFGYRGTCRWSVWQKPAIPPMWQWDGNVEKPTITPSINCHGGCGRHFTVTKGVAA